MSVWTLVQIVVDLFLFVGFAMLAFRLRRPPQDDPRLSRGLQLLQTKITVLEDLSDRTDAQVKQLSGLLDQKTRLLQNKVIEAEHQLVKIDHSMNKSMEVAEIFQDKIPHEEILERQRTIEYVKAARMAHSGRSVDDIAAAVALPREQIELIAKFNREQLMFDESALPDWAQKGVADAGVGTGGFNLSQIDFLGGMEKPQPDFDGIASIDKDFKSAIESVKQQDLAAQATLMDTKVAAHIRGAVNSGMETMQPAVMSMRATAQTLKEKLVATAEDMLRSQNSTAQSVAASASLSFSNPAQSAPTTHTASVTSSTAATPMTPTHIVSSSPIKSDQLNRQGSPLVKKVIFPRIEK